jgi:hypothetical protein
MSMLVGCTASVLRQAYARHDNEELNVNGGGHQAVAFVVSWGAHQKSYSIFFFTSSEENEFREDAGLLKVGGLTKRSREVRSRS